MKTDLKNNFEKTAFAKNFMDLSVKLRLIKELHN